MKLLVCGGAGFIGSNFVRQRIRASTATRSPCSTSSPMPAGEENLADLADAPGFAFVQGGIEDADAVADAIAGADAVVNFAAETHVDRSIAEPDAFITTHALGTFVLLEAARERGVRYVQVSTDEVYGSIEEGSFTEESPLAPPRRTRRPRRAPTCSSPPTPTRTGSRR